jgi:putative intracellular protease/amidase
MTLTRRMVILGGFAGLATACAGRPLPPVDDAALRGAAGKVVVMPLPAEGFDPTETAIPWQLLSERGVRVVFASPEGKIPSADPRMLTGEGLGSYAEQLRADANAREAHAAMRKADDFRGPLAYESLRAAEFDALLLPGGHAPGMKVYLESTVLQRFVGEFFAGGRPVGAICHGVLLAARSTLPGSERSVLLGKRTTALPRHMERLAWTLTRKRLGDYYRTYPVYVQDEVTAVLEDRRDYVVGPRGFKRDSPEDLRPGFVVVDGRYVSARWPGDAHTFALAVLRQLAVA